MKVLGIFYMHEMSKEFIFSYSKLFSIFLNSTCPFGTLGLDHLSWWTPQLYSHVLSCFSRV